MHLLYILQTRERRKEKCTLQYTQTETTKTNSVALVLKQTIPTERPPLASEVSANFSR
jgi:hypothetical protein